MGSFARARPEELPVWLADDVGQAYQRVLGAEWDAELAKLKAAIKIRWPQFAADDAAAFRIGNDRYIERAPGESLTAFLDRCARVLDIAYWWGTKRGIQELFEPFGVEAADVGVYNDYETSYADPPGHWWSRVWIFIDSRFGPWTTDGAWGDPGTWGDGGTWGSSVTWKEIQYIRRRLRREKSPGAIPTQLFVDLSEDGDGLWGSPGTWGDGGAWANEGTTVYVRFIIAHTWGEETAVDGTDGVWGDPGIWEGLGPLP